VPELSVLYDGGCSLCRASVARVRRRDPGGRIELVDLHDPTVATRFPQVDREEAMRLMQAVDGNGRIHSGADAWARIGLALPAWRFLAWILLVPGIHIVAQHIYGWVVRNRYRWNHDLCADGSCALHAVALKPPTTRPASRG
jgi:predicted DCC family thiol-disulfide oxidoreductase YuxK